MSPPLDAGGRPAGLPVLAPTADRAAAALAELTARLGDAAAQGTIKAMLPATPALAHLKDVAEQLGYGARVATLAHDGGVDGEMLPVDQRPVLVLLADGRVAVAIGLAATGDLLLAGEAVPGAFPATGRLPCLVVRERRLVPKPDGARLTFARLLRMGMPNYARALWAGFLLNLLGLLTPFISMTVYNRVLPVNAQESLSALAIGGFLLIGFDIVFRLLQARYIDRAADRADLDVNRAVFQALLTLPLALRPQSTGEASSRVAELDTVRSAMGAAILGAFLQVPFLVLYVATLAYLAPLLSVVAIVLFLAAAGAGWAISKATAGAEMRLSAARTARAKYVSEVVSELDEIKFQGLGPLMAGKHARASEAVAAANAEVNRFGAISQSLAVAIQKAGYLLILVVGALMVMDMSMTIGALVAAGMLGSNALNLAGQVASLLPRVSKGRQAWRSLMREVRDKPSELVAGGRGVGRLAGSIELQQVRARPTAASALVLAGITLKIDAGERVGITGAGGSGKSSLAKLLVGGLDIVEGQVRIGGHGLDQVSIDDVRNVVGYVGQHPAFVSGTLFDNLAVARDLSRDHVANVICELGAEHLLLNDGRGGLDREIEERGRNLSGSQRRAAALVRALLRDPEILILDEISANLDPHSLDHLTKLFERSEQGLLGRKRTILMIDHLTTPALLKCMARWVVLQRGAVLADGAPDEVLRYLRAQQQAHGRVAVAAANRGAVQDPAAARQPELLTDQVQSQVADIEEQ